MKISNIRAAILSSLSKISTIAILLFSVSSLAITHYALTVVTEAQVMAAPSKQSSESHQCKNFSGHSKAQLKMTWYGPENRKPEKISLVGQEKNQQTQLFATRNTDDFGYLNSVTIWLGLRNNKAIMYYPLTTVEMLRYELPHLRIEGKTLIVQADTLTVDPKEENEMMKVPTVPGHLYQTIQTGTITEMGLAVTQLNCAR